MIFSAVVGFIITEQNIVFIDLHAYAQNFIPALSFTYHECGIPVDDMKQNFFLSILVIMTVA